MNTENNESCRRIQDELFEAVDAGTPPSAEVREHLASCEACREHYRQLTQLIRTLDEDAGPVNPLREGLAAKITAAAREKRGQVPFLAMPHNSTGGSRPKRREKVPDPFSRRWVRPLLAAAAAVLLVVGVWQLLEPREPVTLIKRTDPLTATQDMTEDLMGQMAQLAAEPAGDMDRVLEDAGELGDELLAAVPVELIPGVDRAFVETLLMGPPRSSGPTTRRQRPNGGRSKSGERIHYGGPVLFPSFAIILYNEM